MTTATIVTAAAALSRATDPVLKHYIRRFLCGRTVGYDYCVINDPLWTEDSSEYHIDGEPHPDKHSFGAEAVYATQNHYEKWLNHGAADRVAVLQAFLEDKTIQVTTPDGLRWFDLLSNGSFVPAWDFDTFKYRVKPSAESKPARAANPWSKPEPKPYVEPNHYSKQDYIDRTIHLLKTETDSHRKWAMTTFLAGKRLLWRRPADCWRKVEFPAWDSGTEYALDPEYCGPTLDQQVKLLRGDANRSDQAVKDANVAVVEAQKKLSDAKAFSEEKHKICDTLSRMKPGMAVRRRSINSTQWQNYELDGLPIDTMNYEYEVK